MQRAGKVIVILAALALSPIVTHAQVVSLESGLLRDDIPALIQQSKLSLLYPLSGEIISQTSYRYLFADQDPFNGIPRLRVPLHTLEQAFHARVLTTGLSVDAKGSLTMLPTDKFVGDFGLGAAYALPVPVSPGDPPIIFTARVEGGRSRDLSVSTAMHENISHREAAGQLDVSLMEVLELSGRAMRFWYNDGNRKDAAYGYLLANVLANPKIVLGYAWSWTDTKWSNWRATGTEFDPATRDYTFEYFYYPYFTPLKERGHYALAIVQWFIHESVLLHAKATVPVHSRGQLKYMPVTGRTPFPIDYGVTYEVEDILPTQYEGGILASLTEQVTLGISVEYFSKPYYTYTAGRLALQYNFGGE